VGMFLMTRAFCKGDAVNSARSGRKQR